TIQKLGPIKEVFEKLPLGDMAQGMNLDDKQLKRVEAIIQSMTQGEREKPEIIDESRITRIASGSGTKNNEVRDLVKRFFAMRQLMGQVGKQPGLLSKIPGFKQLSQLKDIQGLDMGDMMGNDMGGGMDPMAAMQAGIPMGMPTAGDGRAAGDRRMRTASQIAKAKSRKKMAKKSRKKSRRK
ncbi:MAG TPA: signal recognition particle protein, partial [Myxococcales bacterium]|nr:signal recognition particle protein [Myxococcales bacterium]